MTFANSARAAVAITGVTLLTAVTLAAPAQARTYGQERLQRDVDALKATGASGVLAEVRLSSRTLTARAGVSDLGTGEPVDWNAYHRIGSTTKTFVATVVLQLAGEGRLSLDDTVDRWLPGLVEGGAEVTVRQLLGHTSGLPDYADDVPLERATTEEEFRRERFRTYGPGQLVAMAMRHRPVFPPGTGWAYSNTNYVLASMIIEKVTGTPWQQQLHERVIEPLGLRHTFTPGTSPFLPRPHLRTYRRLTPGGPAVDVTVYAAGQADGSVISTPHDVNRFYGALLGGRLLRPAQLAEMKETVPAAPYKEFWREAGYGLGLMKRRLSCGDWVWFHAGGGWNAVTDNAVTTDGRRSAVVAYATTLGPDQSPLQQIKTSAALIDRALCADRP
ncbi:serine hydrolase domain-containing protein [Nonomuraea sp. NPDC050643]|uniref:serine hydrolase domain-containing protein n=1 Tax=Nonomuraea sp. NPDC050643 TaxID=3155660 RepID=UPI003407A70B